MNIKRAVSRFLSWRLPDDFAPDGGISFKRESDYDHPQLGRTKFEPVGTNLLHAGQAEAMIKHILAVTPGDLTDFGGAIYALKNGKRVTREGWNGKGMWLSLSGVANIAKDVPAEAFWSPHNAAYAAKQPERMAKVLPCITMKTATGEILMGWLASQSDMLAEDWMVLE